MSQYILITIFVLAKAWLLLADGLVVMQCDDNTSLRKFNLCIPKYGLTIRCEISPDTHRNNHGFRLLKNGTDMNGGVSPNHARYYEDPSYQIAAYISISEGQQPLRLHCVRYNTTDGEDVDKVCSKAQINFYDCAEPDKPTEILLDEAENATLHCGDAPYGSDIQWYFAPRYKYTRFLTTGYTTNVNNLTNEAAGEYSCVAVAKSFTGTIAYKKSYNLKVHEHFRTADGYITKRGSRAVSFKCLPIGIVTRLDHVNISKWTVQYTSLKADQYNKWSKAESSGNTIALTGLTPSTWYLMKGQATDTTGKTVPMSGIIFKTESIPDHSTVDMLSGSMSNVTFPSNETYEEHIDYTTVAMQGDNVVLECGFNMDHLKADFDLETNWTRRWIGLLPKNNSKYRRLNQSLVIRGFSPEDGDIYRCHLTATAKKPNAGFTDASLIYVVKINVSSPAEKAETRKPMGVVLPPLEVHCVNSTATTITVAWSENPKNTDVTGHKVQYWKRTDGDETAVKKEVFLKKKPQGTQYEFIGLQPHTAYGFNISAVSSAGDESKATMKSCSTL